MFLGVDGGGTHTRYVLVDAAGVVRARCESGSAYYPEVGMQALRTQLHAGVHEVLSLGGIGPEGVRYAFFGLPVHGEDERTPELDGLPAGVLPEGRYACGNDMVSGWAGSLAGADGINVVAGTGSIAYGEHAGRSARCGGWGELFSDEGSAYWIAREGLQLFSRMSDGRIAQGPLLALVRSQLGLRFDLQLGTHISGVLGMERSRIAALAQLVDTAAAEGDGAAQAILARAGDELAALVHAIRRLLAVPDTHRLPVSHSGGVFAGCQRVAAAFAAALEASGVKYELRAPRFAPDIGAALQAARLAGSPLGAEALSRLG